MRSLIVSIGNHENIRSSAVTLRFPSAVRLVLGVSLFRLLATLLFAALLLLNVPNVFLALTLGLAGFSDAIDGYLSRALGAETKLGKVLDLIADRAVTAVSLLYASARGVDLLPLAAIGIRDLVAIGMRLIEIDGRQVLPTSRSFGGATALFLWTTTIYLVLQSGSGPVGAGIRWAYWTCAAVMVLNIATRIWSSRGRLANALRTTD